MSEETIVAVFDTAEHAQAARTALVGAGVPESDISLHAGTGMTTGPAGAPVREQGFWASLFGGEPGYDTAVYDRSLANGSTVMSVNARDEHVVRVLEILERYRPINIDERAASYGLTTAAATRQSTAAPVPAEAARTGEETMQLSEERLVVGKHVVNQGGVRVRRYVVETPVEENVSLHSERVVLERRPVTDGRPVGADEFGDRTIEMTESAEEAVVSKTARVVEEIGLRKEATDRVETIRDTVRKEEAEVVEAPAAKTTATITPVPATGGAGGTAVLPKR